MQPFEIEKEDVERLDQFALTNFLKKLLRAEISKLKLRQAESVVSLDINDPDGGLDGYIGCEIPEKHTWLPSGRSGWQFKAVKSFPPSKVEEEVLTKDKTDVKSRIKKLLQKGETYVIVIGGKDYNKEELEKLEEKTAETFGSKGYLESKVKVYSSGQIADWANSFPSIVAYLKPDRSSFKDIKEWRKTTRVIKEPSKFVSDPNREEIIRSIRETIVSNHTGERGTIIRLVGLSGVGKTRLIYEALDTDELKELVLYTESPDKLPLSRLNEIARNGKITAIFAIDECPHDKYVELSKEAEGIGGRITLVTLDYDIDLSRDPKDMHVVLRPLDEDASDRLIQLTTPGLPETARRRIVEFSKGYPRTAVLLSENFSSHPDILSARTLSELGIADLYERTIAGRYVEASVIEKIKNVLTIIALFSRLGWDEEVSKQGKKVCEHWGIKWTDARKIVKEQEERGLVIKRGRYRYVTPLPLAIYLASSWWETMDESEWLDFFKNLPNLETRKAFMDRLSDLPYLEHAKNALKKIFSEFNYKLLDTKVGSEIFLSLAKADHMSAIETLERILGPLSREKLLEFATGRRNVVWALQKIGWWQDSFHRTVRLLLKLADAENETWSNNATGTFTQFFQTFLGGTCVPAWERHSILEEALILGNKSLQKLVLKGLNAAFNLLHATRNMVGEEQGTVVVPAEWNPRSREDLRKSVTSALKILDKAIVLPDSEIQTEATKVFLSHVRILLASGFKDEVMERLRIINKIPELDKELVKTVERVIHYDSEKLPEDVIAVVRDFREKLIGGDFHGLMKRYVKSQLVQDQLKENREKVDGIVRNLAEESMKFPEKLMNELKWLVTQEAENGYIFGKFLAELDTECYWLDIILQATKDSESPSAYFLGGYLSSVKMRNTPFWEKILQQCYGDEILKKLLLEIIWRSGTSDESAKLLIKMLKNQEIKPQEISLFNYGAWFSGVSASTFVEFLVTYHKIEDGKYAPVVLGMIDQYTDQHPSILTDAKDILLEYLMSPTIFEKHDTMTMYYWEKLSKKMMVRFDDTVPYFLDSILQTLTKEGIDYLESDFHRELQYLLEKDVETIWKKIKEVMLANDLRAWRLAYLLKGHYFADRPSLIGLIPESRLMDWVKRNPDKAPYTLARIIPLHASEPLFHPLAKMLLTEYPNDEDLKSLLSDNWHTESFSGSASQHFEKKLRIAEKWAEDPETAVAKWAEDQVRYIKTKIKEARKREEESGF